ncbi:acyl-CoA dehydrogenase family protein [Winogradskya humida]|uniref:Isovaleryl-CoA dehydrogenase n=1 Tax=Winogradskya humida TaxID=113566 RepID=A0ABQ3ZZ54_9ACTN|nr:acyl-CoA dehydrogenase family protein [Actinoplanes humidus]GIE23879.1 isovaleryl-CoA dehydrogenase [Actinoplanes humidus]
MTAADIGVEQESFDQWLAGLRFWAARADAAAYGWGPGPIADLLGLAVPEQLGGSGLGYRAACQALATLAEETGRSGLPFSLAAQMWATQEPLIAFGSPRQREVYLSGLITARMVGAFAATEYEAGSDLLSMRTTATRDAAGRWVLEGSKTFVTNGPDADIFVILARTAPGSALGGLTAFCVPRNTSGLTVGPEIAKTALTGARLCSLSLNACAVVGDAVLGQPGGGFAVLMHAMRVERALILAPVAGLMSRALQRAVEYARTRRQFGRPLAEQDAIRAHLVRMRLSLTSVGETLSATAADADAGRLDHTRSSLTKLHVSTEFNTFCQHLPDIYGGYAVLAESGVTDLIADAVASRFYSGTTDMQMKIIAEGMGL